MLQGGSVSSTFLLNLWRILCQEMQTRKSIRASIFACYMLVQLYESCLWVELSWISLSNVNVDSPREFYLEKWLFLVSSTSTKLNWISWNCRVTITSHPLGTNDQSEMYFRPTRKLDANPVHGIKGHYLLILPRAGRVFAIITHTWNVPKATPESSGWQRRHPMTRTGTRKG